MSIFFRDLASTFMYVFVRLFVCMFDPFLSACKITFAISSYQSVMQVSDQTKVRSQCLYRIKVFFGGKIFFLGNLSSPITSCFTQKDNWSLLMLCWRHFVCVCNFSERDCTNYKGTWTGTELPSSVNFPCLANKIHNFFSDWYLLNSERLLVFW